MLTRRRRPVYLEGGINPEMLPTGAGEGSAASIASLSPASNLEGLENVRGWKTEDTANSKAIVMNSADMPKDKAQVRLTQREVQGKMKEDTDSQKMELAKPIELPQSLIGFFHQMKKIGFFEGSLKREEFSYEVQNIIKYTNPSLETGRPLNKVMIVMSGQSGAGKSTTINALFNTAVCETNALKSETREVTEYGKKLSVKYESPPIEAYLSFVDIPGSHDVEQRLEAINLATILKFRKNHSDLVERSSKLPFTHKISEKVYPNLVLMIVKAGDNRKLGPDSDLNKSLKVLKECRFVDTNRSNLIVVISHAMTIGTVPAAFERNSEQEICYIRKAIYDVLCIKDVQIVFVENNPNDYGIEKDEKSDFYKLPNGELSHYNLFQAITEHLTQNGDNLGRLLCSWYFADRCPEKNDKPQVLQSFKSEKVSEKDTKQAEKALQRLNSWIQKEIDEDRKLPQFPFRYLGRGYCPKSELTKNVTIHSESDTKQANILGKNYTIPNFLQIVPINECHYRRRSCETREMYEKSRLTSYGLEADIKLVVNVDSRGRWLNSNKAVSTHSEVSILYEIYQTNIRMDEPEKNMKEQLAEHISKLPNEFNEKTVNSFVEFFSKWGSHFICEVWLGGSIMADYSVKVSAFNDEMDRKVENMLRSTISSCEGHVGTIMSDTSTQDIQDEHLTITGGDTLHATTLKDLAPDVKAWIESTKTKSSELPYSFKLCPYYDLIDGERKTSLRFATKAYLNGSITEKLITTRDAASADALKQVKEESNNKNCFPPSATVCTKDGLVAFKDLRPGTNVLTVNCAVPFGLQNGKLRFTEMYAYIHHNSEMVANYLVFRLENGRSLTVTGDHIIFSYSNGTVKSVRAKRLKVGDNLICTAEMTYSCQNVKPVRIVEISHSTIKGVYSPLTYDGRLIVDGNLVSCYAHIDSHSIAHISMTPLHLWYKISSAIRVSVNYINSILWPAISNCSTSLSVAKFKHQPISGIHEYATFLMSIRSLLPFELLQD